MVLFASKFWKKTSSPYLKCIFEENEKVPILFKFIMDEIQAFGMEVKGIAKQFAIR